MYLYICLVRVAKKVLNYFQDVLMRIIAKVGFIIYLFTFVVAILGVLTHLKMCQSSLLICTKYKVGGTHF